ncbi:hypothetical protein N8J89_29805 [Crossiella sp. CA-258035]|uniref:hypothetical protein n=1 Tax=Crossiella sp. CA-258035 TaxID=2981138 RepID=UPI0024BCAAD1|nr:hypothetical protein [Crossiella sp. CA-258035]WHT17301.1 hypothetical protein N8J89_29805 [Crossiella sp. CA-258035]
MSENFGRLAIFLAVIGTAAAVVSASTDVFGLLKDDPATQESPAPAPVGQPGNSTAPTSPVAKAEPWRGSLVLDGTGLDLDTTPPIRDPKSSADWDFYYGSPLLITFGAGRKNLARWTGKHTPSEKECVDLLAAESVGNAPIAQGHLYCARSRLGRLALLKITGRKGDGQGADITLWGP